MGARLTAEERRWVKVLTTLNEAQARWFVADKALDLGRGGGSRLSQVTGMSRMTITKAIKELRDRGALQPAAQGRVRREGAGLGSLGQKVRANASVWCSAPRIRNRSRRVTCDDLKCHNRKSPLIRAPVDVRRVGHLLWRHVSRRAESRADRGRH